MTGPAAIAVVATMGLLVFLALVVLEERGRPQVALGAVLGTLLLDALLYPGQGDVPTGILRLSFAGQSLRLSQILIVMALFARLLVRGLPRRITPLGLVWSAFFIWYATGAVIGSMRGNAFDWTVFQAKAVLDVGGGLALAAGIPPMAIVRRQVVARWVAVLGLVTLVVIGLSETSVRFSLPLFPGARFGDMGADAASVLVTIGVVALLVEASRRRRRLAVALAAVPLLLCPFTGRQRAAVVNLAAAVAVIALFALGRTWRRRIRTTHTEVGLFLAALLMPFLMIIVFSSATATSGTTDTNLPFTDLVTETFFSTAKQQSADTRVALWAEGRQLARDHPWIGWGLGKEYRTFAEGPKKEVTGGGFHSVVVDLLVRSGVVGLTLFLVAVAMSLVHAARSWFDHPDSAVAALALACGAAVVGLLGKGLVESMLEKFRLATLFGLLLGVILAAAAATREHPEDEDDRAEDEEALAWS